MAEISVNAWRNYDHWDKSKGGLNVKIKSKEEVAKAQQKRKILFVTIIVIAVIIVITAIILTIVFTLPDPEPYSRGTNTLHTIRKVKFLSKNSILTKPQHFHEFFKKFFFDNFSREIKVVNS